MTKSNRCCLNKIFLLLFVMFWGVSFSTVAEARFASGDRASSIELESESSSRVKRLESTSLDPRDLEREEREEKDDEDSLPSSVSFERSESTHSLHPLYIQKTTSKQLDINLYLRGPPLP